MANDSTLAIEEFFNQRSIEVSGTADADTLYGTRFADLIHGGAGNDTLIGGTGSDSYLYNIGDGADTLIDSTGLPVADASGQERAQVNTLSFGPGIGADAVTPSWDGTTLTLDLGPSTGSGQAGDSLVLGALTDLAIQNLRFDDGTTQTLEALLTQRGVVQPVGTASDDVMAAFGNSQPLRGVDGFENAPKDGGKCRIGVWRVT